MNGREEEYTFSTPYVDNSQVIVVAENRMKTLKICRKECYVQALVAADWIFYRVKKKVARRHWQIPFSALNEFADYNTAFTELQAGAPDALAIDVGVANYQIKSRGEGYRF